MNARMFNKSGYPVAFVISFMFLTMSSFAEEKGLPLVPLPTILDPSYSLTGRRVGSCSRLSDIGGY